MKLKLIVVPMFFIMSVLLFTSCNAETSNERNSTVVKGIEFNKVIEQGLINEGASLQDILYDESINDNKVIFFTAQDSLGLAYISKEKYEWKWERFTPYYNFKSSSSEPSAYMNGGTEITTPDGRKYYLAMGKIFNNSIAKITIDNDSIDAIIREKQGNTFWFKLIDSDIKNREVKIYNKDGKELKIEKSLN